MLNVPIRAGREARLNYSPTLARQCEPRHSKAWAQAMASCNRAATTLYNRGVNFPEGGTSVSFTRRNLSITVTRGDVSNATALPPAHPVGAGSTRRRHSAGFSLAALIWRAHGASATCGPPRKRGASLVDRGGTP